MVGKLPTSGVNTVGLKYLAARSFDKLRTGSERIEGRRLIFSRFLRHQSENIDGIDVRGESEFRARTREALQLLKKTAALALVQAYVKVIRQGKRSGMRAGAHRPTFIVGRATWQHSPLWYAGAIAHDAYHSKLYHSASKNNGGGAPAPPTWTGADAEKQCLAFQYAVLETLNCDENTLRYIARWTEHPTYGGRPRGFAAWLDYLRRWW
jgi:hypothetical protein